MTKEKNPRYFYVGQKVYTPWGEGVVKVVDVDDRNIVQVSISVGFETKHFTFDGRLRTDGPIVVATNPFPVISNTPLPEITEGLKHGDAVWVRNGKHQKWLLRVFRAYCLDSDTPYIYSIYALDGGMWETVIFCEKFDPATVDEYI